MSYEVIQDFLRHFLKRAQCSQNNNKKKKEMFATIFCPVSISDRYNLSSFHDYLALGGYLT